MLKKDDNSGIQITMGSMIVEVFDAVSPEREKRAAKAIKRALEEME